MKHFKQKKVQAKYLSRRTSLEFSALDNHCFWQSSNFWNDNFLFSYFFQIFMYLTQKLSIVHKSLYSNKISNTAHHNTVKQTFYPTNYSTFFKLKQYLRYSWYTRYFSINDTKSIRVGWNVIRLIIKNYG